MPDADRPILLVLDDYHEITTELIQEAMAALLQHGQPNLPLVVTVGTIEKHLNDVFGKLDVTSRTQAVARARDLNLLSQDRNLTINHPYSPLDERHFHPGHATTRLSSRGAHSGVDVQDPGWWWTQTDHFAATDRTLVAQVPADAVRTLYAAAGPWFEWLSVAGFAVLLAYGMR